MTTSRRRVWVFRISAVVLGVVVATALVEGSASAALHYLPNPTNVAPAHIQEELPQPRDGSPERSHEDLGIENTPSFSNRWCSTNSIGLRNGEITPTRAAETFRVLIMGGSVAWGYAARSNAETISAHVERRLREVSELHEPLTGKHIEVLNAGVVGYRSWQVLRAYTRKWRTLAPDVVVSIDGVNEVVGAVYRGSTTSKSSSSGLSTRTSTSWLDRRIRRLKVYRLWQRLMPPALASLSIPTATEVAESYARHLEGIAEMTSADGSVFLPILQPTLVCPGERPPTPFEVRLIELNEQIATGINAYFRDCYREIRAAVRTLSADYGRVYPADATNVFADETEIMFVDFCHLSSKGRKVFAEYLAERILERL